jgi:triacylglycerol lipase
MNKKLRRWLLVGVWSLSALAHADNSDPIVLVHGFAGWGRDELFGLYPHWGGTTDLQEELKKLGYDTVTAASGPTSSTWDRAVETYAVINGGCVDYGRAHAARHGHDRFGRCFTGLKKSFARGAQWDEQHKVHLIAHSQGAQVSNMLTHLLREGSQEEVNASGGDVSELFKGGKNWVRSVTTVAGANNGTTFGKLTGFNEFAKQLLKNVAALFGGSGNPEDLPYDFKLDQWGLKKLPTETKKQYWDRVWASPIWNTKDVALYTLSPEGAAEENAWVTTSPETYYFSYTNGTTFKGLLTGNHYPSWDTNLLLSPFALGMGWYRNYGKNWLENDGVVNTYSMKAPFGRTVVEYNGTAQKGAWNHMGFSHADHWDVIGSGDFGNNLTRNTGLINAYAKQAAVLRKLN